MSGDTASELRIDRWLWFTRFFKTRSLATAAVSGGHVKVNGERARPGQRIAAGDKVVVVRDQLRYELEIVTLPVRRGPAAEARATYVEAAESVLRREKALAGLRQDRLQMPRTPGRPDKRTRQKLRDYHRRQGDPD